MASKSTENLLYFRLFSLKTIGYFTLASMVGLDDQKLCSHCLLIGLGLPSNLLLSLFFDRTMCSGL